MSVHSRSILAPNSKIRNDAFWLAENCFFKIIFFSIFRNSVILRNFNENCEPLKAAIHDNVESAKLIRKFQEPGEVEYDEFAKKYAVDINVRQIRLPEIFYLVFWPFMLKEKYLDQTLGHKVGYLQ